MSIIWILEKVSAYICDVSLFLVWSKVIDQNPVMKWLQVADTDDIYERLHIGSQVQKHNETQKRKSDYTATCTNIRDLSTLSLAKKGVSVKLWFWEKE